MYLSSDKYNADRLGLSVEKFQGFVEPVKAALAKADDGRVQIGVSLYAFYHGVKRRRLSGFYNVCSQVFKLDRSEVSRYIKVVEEFGNETHEGLAEEYKAYSFSLLVEIMTIPKAERHKIGPDWTVKNVREFRRVLERSGVEEESEAEKPPDRYVRFKKWKRTDLCEKIIELEKQLEDLSQIVSKNK